MSVQRFFVRRFAATFGSDLALVDAVHRHTADIVNRVDGAGQTRGSRIARDVRRGVTFFVI